MFQQFQTSCGAYGGPGPWRLIKTGGRSARGAQRALLHGAAVGGGPRQSVVFDVWVALLPTASSSSTSSWKSALSPSPVDPMWSPAATSATMTDEDLQPMCLDNLLSREVSHPVNTAYQCGPGENWEVPINGGFLDSEAPTTPGAQPAGCSEADSYEIPKVPLESIGGGIPPPSPE